MKLIEAFNADLFKNPKVAEAIKHLILLEEDFDKKGQGNVLAGHIMSLSNTFRSEQMAILTIIEKVQAAGGNVGLGKKRRTNKPKTKVRFIQPNKVNTAFDPEEDCPGCDKETDEVDVSPKKTTKQKTTKSAAKPATTAKSKRAAKKKEIETYGLTDEDLLKAKSWREVMNSFLGDEDLMVEFCKMQGIKRGNEKDASKLSKLIFKNLGALTTFV